MTKEKLDELIKLGIAGVLSVEQVKAAVANDIGLHQEQEKISEKLTNILTSLL